MTQQTSAFEYEDAISLYNTEKYDVCVCMCRKGVEAGDPKAQYLLARCHIYGRGVGKDQNEAVRLLKRSAAQSEPLAQNLLGWCFQHGAGGLTADFKTAEVLFRRSAAHGCVDGQIELGFMVEPMSDQPSGQSRHEDTGERLRLYSMAAAQGDGVALYNLGHHAGAKHRPPDKMKHFYLAATAADTHIETKWRRESIKECAALAHRLTDPSASKKSHGQFIAGITACVDDAVLAAHTDLEHASQLARALNQLRTQAPRRSIPAHRDVSLQAGGRGFPCHRLILMAASGFFRALFDGGSNASKAPAIQLNGCGPELAERLIVYMYTGRITFAGVEDAAEVLNKAEFYQINTLVRACMRYIQPRLGAYNSMAVEVVAQGPLSSSLAKSAQRCTALNFDIAATGAAFFRSSFKALTTLLDQEAVHATDEGVVLDAVLRWASLVWT